MPIAKKRILVKDFNSNIIARYDSIISCAKDMDLSPATVKHEADKVRTRKTRTNIITYENQSDEPKEVKIPNVWRCEKHNVLIGKKFDCPLCLREPKEQEQMERIRQQFRDEEI